MQTGELMLDLLAALQEDPATKGDPQAMRGLAHRAAAVPALPAAALSAGSLAAFAPPPGVVRLLVAADRDAKGRRAAARLKARMTERGVAATVLVPEHGDFNDDLAALGPRALAARLAPLLDAAA